MYNPLFPDRPQHPDFIRISHCVIATDMLAEGEASFAEVARRWVDPDSLVYMAQQRTARQLLTILTDPSPPDLMLMTTAAWVDGFLAGACFSQDGGTASSN